MTGPWDPVPPEVVMLNAPSAVPVNPNVPLPPTVFLVMDRVAWLVLVNVQLAESPAATSMVAATSPAVKLESG